MTFTLPDLTFLLQIVIAVAVVGGVVAVASLSTFLVRHHDVRVRRHEGVLRYYGHLVAGH